MKYRVLILDGKYDVQSIRFFEKELGYRNTNWEKLLTQLAIHGLDSGLVFRRILGEKCCSLLSHTFYSANKNYFLFLKLVLDTSFGTRMATMLPGVSVTLPMRSLLVFSICRVDLANINAYGI